MTRSRTIYVFRNIYRKFKIKYQKWKGRQLNWWYSWELNVRQPWHTPSLCNLSSMISTLSSSKPGPFFCHHLVCCLRIKNSLKAKSDTKLKSIEALKFLKCLLHTAMYCFNVEIHSVSNTSSKSKLTEIKWSMISHAS